MKRALNLKTESTNYQSKGCFLTYKEFPEIDFSIDEIVSLAFYRYQFHEELRSINEMADNADEKKTKITSLFSKYFFPLRNITSFKPINKPFVPEAFLNKYTQKELDQNAFYSLLLLSLTNEDMQKSFIQGECQIFKYRLIYLEDSTITIHDIPKEILEHARIDFESYLDGNEFKIPFEKIFPYIDVTHCTLKDGLVTLNFFDLMTIFVSFFHDYLEKTLKKLKQHKINELEIFKVINSMFDEKRGAFFTQDRTNWNAVSLDDLDNLAHRSFPPCMYNMYTKLKSAHKLFHTGRLQLGLFLKGIGLSLNDSLKLWRDEFSKFGIPLDQFERQYAYNIRYNYGKEGSCRNFSPYSCMGMIRMPDPAIGQTHGCPFMQMRKDDCKAILKRMFRDSKKNKGAAFDDKCEAIAEKGIKHPQIACTLLFNELHSKPYEDSAVRHPCEYFSFSEEQFKEMEEQK